MKFNSNNDPASAVSVEEFERKRGVTLPRDYVKFLLSENGGQLDPSQSYAEIPNWNSLEVQELFGLTTNASHSIAADHFSNFSDFVHIRMLQIGYNPFGETICMDLRDLSHGRIYIRTHNSPLNDPILIDAAGFEDEGDYEEASLFHPLAENWTTFVAMLGPAPPITD